MARVNKDARDTMLAYLQSMMDDFKCSEKRYGEDNPWTEKKLGDMIACKEMVEALIEECVNLQSDGRVTVGLY